MIKKRDNLYICSKFFVFVIVILINLKNIYLMNKFRGLNIRSIQVYNLEVVYMYFVVIEFILKNEYEKLQYLQFLCYLI